MSDNKVNVSLIPIPDKAIEELGKRTYDDVLKPPLQQVGLAAGGLLRFVALPFSFLGLTAVQLEEKYKNFIQKTINKVPVDKIETPSAIIAGQILEHVKYLFEDENDNLLSEMLSELLASAINKDNKNAVKPSYVNALKQLGANEALVLNQFVGRYHEYALEALPVLFSQFSVQFNAKISKTGNEFLEIESAEADIFDTYPTEKIGYEIHSAIVLREEINITFNEFNSAIRVLKQQGILNTISIIKYADREMYTFEKPTKGNEEMFDLRTRNHVYALTDFGIDLLTMCTKIK